MIDRVYSDYADAQDGIDRLVGIRTAQDRIEYSLQVCQVDAAGQVLQDLTSDVVIDDTAVVKWDSDQDIPGDLTLNIRSTVALVWNRDILSVSQLQRSQQYNRARGIDSETWHRFPLNQFVVTTPGRVDLDAAAVRTVTGYDKNYLLRVALNDSLAFDEGSTYKDAVTAGFVGAGLLDGADDLSVVCDYPNDWATKTLAAPADYVIDDSGTTYLSMINEQLKASGCVPLFPGQTGRWQIVSLPTPGAPPASRWFWAGGVVAGDPINAAALRYRVVLRHQSQYSGDVWDVPNQFVAIQRGLTFEPVDGAGQYTYDNLTIPPSDQGSTQSVRRKTSFYDASGQDDLEAQARADIQTQLGQVEQITFQTAAWPIAGHRDVFTYSHPALPFQSRRLVRAQSWRLPLRGDPMSWSTNPVVDLG